MLVRTVFALVAAAVCSVPLALAEDKVASFNGFLAAWKSEGYECSDESRHSDLMVTCSKPLDATKHGLLRIPWETKEQWTFQYKLSPLGDKKWWLLDGEGVVLQKSPLLKNWQPRERKSKEGLPAALRFEYIDELVSDNSPPDNAQPQAGAPKS